MSEPGRPHEAPLRRGASRGLRLLGAGSRTRRASQAVVTSRLQTVPASRRSEEAPDYTEPVLGWRRWFVVSVDETLRLCSPLYGLVWLPRHETVALCSRPTFPHHLAPAERCDCGVYASHTAAAAAHPLVEPSPIVGRPIVHSLVVGRVALWGKVVECEYGWRAERAYPTLLYVPTAHAERRSWLRRAAPSVQSAEQVALALQEYAVPVELVECKTADEFVDRLRRQAEGG